MITHTVMREDRGYVNPREYGTALNHTTLQAALTAIGSTPAGLLLTPGTWSIGVNLTIPAHVTLVRSRGAMVSISAGVTLTLNGDQEGPLAAWISGAGTLVFGSPVQAYSSWWSTPLGSPAGVLSAPVGSTYINTAGGTNTTRYLKETGTGTSAGWVAK